MRLNRTTRNFTAIVFVTALLVAPVCFAVEGLSQSEEPGANVVMSRGSWVITALDSFVSWLLSSPSSDLCPDDTTDCTGGGTTAPDSGGTSMPEPDNGPGLDPQG